MSVSGVSSRNNSVQTHSSQGGTNPSTDSSLKSIESTFLSLLVQELQNQDPTAPMDSTQMVGQMISLNQLDQLASINQVVTNALGSSPAPVTGGTSGS
jgi:flagellar basal-body rod modification protein FlgD